MRRKAWLFSGHQPPLANFKVLEPFCGRPGDLGPAGKGRSGKVTMLTSDRIEKPGTKGTEGRERERKQASFIKSNHRIISQWIDQSPLPLPSNPTHHYPQLTVVQYCRGPRPDYSRASFPGTTTAGRTAPQPGQNHHQYVRQSTAVTVPPSLHGTLVLSRPPTAAPLLLPNHPAALARSPSYLPSMAQAPSISWSVVGGRVGKYSTSWLVVVIRSPRGTVPCSAVLGKEQDYSR